MIGIQLHGAECVVLRIGNKNGFPFVEVTCSLVEVTRFFLKKDLQDDRALTQPGGALRVTSPFEKSTKWSPLQGHLLYVHSLKEPVDGSVLYFLPKEK